MQGEIYNYHRTQVQLQRIMLTCHPVPQAPLYISENIQAYTILYLYKQPLFEAGVTSVK